MAFSYVQRLFCFCIQGPKQWCPPYRPPSPAVTSTATATSSRRTQHWSAKVLHENVVLSVIRSTIRSAVHVRHLSRTVCAEVAMLSTRQGQQGVTRQMKQNVNFAVALCIKTGFTD